MKKKNDSSRFDHSQNHQMKDHIFVNTDGHAELRINLFSVLFLLSGRSLLYLSLVSVSCNISYSYVSPSALVFNGTPKSPLHLDDFPDVYQNDASIEEVLELCGWKLLTA